MTDHEPRDGEVVLPFDPDQTADDARVAFIGRIASPWASRSECPKNLRQARERGLPAKLIVDPAWRPGLGGLSAGQAIVALYWMDQSQRNLIVQKPRHRDHPVGVFAIRSPARPNPISIAVVRIVEIDRQAGILTIDAIDCIDGTPLVDIKPWLDTVDIPPGA